MSKDPDNVMEERMVTMPKWAWKRALKVRHQIEEERGRTITKGDENRLIFFAGIPTLERCADCRAGRRCEEHARACGPIVDEPAAPAPVATKSRRSKAAG